MISEGGRKMLGMITEAALLGDLAAIKCEDLETGEKVEVLCSAQPEPDGSVRILPLAILVDADDPTAGLKPPEGALPEERLLS